jgi:hypothetical protein
MKAIFAKPGIILVNLFSIQTVLMLSLILLISCAGKLSEEELQQELVFKPVDPLEKIFKETAFFREIEPVAHVARGEHASFQYALRSMEEYLSNVKLSVMDLRNGANTLSNVKVGYIGYVSVGRNTPNHSRDKLSPISGLYPDPILEKESIDLMANETQPIWLTIEIPQDAQPGIYEGEVILTGEMDGQRFEIIRPIQVKVHPVTIEKTRLWVTNWYNTSPANIQHVMGGEEVAPYNEDYWTFVRMLASKMAEYRQNVSIISPLRLAEFGLDDTGNYTFDFTNFDRTVDIFIEEGVIGRIEGGHIGTRAAGWVSDFVVFAPVIEEDTTYLKKFSIRNDTARAFYSAFIPALTRHLKDKGWDNIYMQHLMDEPTPANVDTYIEIANFIDKLAPDLKIVEACHSKDVNETVDIWVPQLDYMHIDYDFYRERAEQGDEIWFYTCLNPKGEYANRFIELPLIKTRILHWINYRFNIPGYLHWGFNFWRGGDPFIETTSINLESGTILPGGDAWICYPGDHKILSSIRLEAMRDGIIDYELLCMLGEKNPEEAAELARQVVYRFDYYDINVKAFRQKRRKILSLLSE